MKKQYMDFVPTQKKSAGSKSVIGARGAAAPKRVVATSGKAAVAPKGVAGKSSRGASSRPVSTTNRVTFGVEKEKKLGAIEDLGSRFVKSDVPKRPLGQESHFVAKKTGVAAAKAKRIGARRPGAAVEKPVEKSVGKAAIKSAAGKSAYRVPTTPFINQNKVEKRPLSKNVYAKKVEPVKEEPKGPVTIISKPEKQAHVGLIVTIILTIILGAAAGTVAFLLLPK